VRERERYARAKYVARGAGACETARGVRVRPLAESSADGAFIHVWRREVKV
jgi:hypothetical protein